MNKSALTVWFAFANLFWLVLSYNQKYPHHVVLREVPSPRGSPLKRYAAPKVNVFILVRIYTFF